jgi:hypothetical protein
MPGHPGTPTSDAARARVAARTRRDAARREYAVPVVHEICPIHPRDRGHALCRAVRAHRPPADARATGCPGDGWTR